MTVCTNCDSEGKYYVGDIGTEIIVDTCSDISAATEMKLSVEKPDGEVVEWSGTLYDTTNIKYVVQDGDFDQSGEYTLQSYVEISGWSGRGNSVTFRVSPVFS